MASYEWDAEWAASVGLPVTGIDPRPPRKDVFEMRGGIEASTSGAMSTLPSFKTIQRSEPSDFTSFDGKILQITCFADPAKAGTDQNPSPAIVYIHGGGFVANSVDHFAPRIAQLADGTGLPVFAVSYRLAPESPAPAALEDVLAGLRHIAARKDVNAQNIVLLGESSGGGLAMGVTLMARDRGLLNDELKLARLVLVYPMLDHRTKLDDGHPMERFLTATSAANTMAWSAYLQGGDGNVEIPEDLQISEYASPARAKNLAGLPPTYIEVGSLDLFCQEDVEMAARLTRDGTTVELHVWPGVPHGFDGVAGSNMARKAIALRFESIRKAVGRL